MTISPNRTLLAAIAGLALVGATAPIAAAETLAEAIAAAYDNNPNLQAQRATQRALDETYVQARSGWRPTLTLQGSGTFTYLRTPESERVRLERGATKLWGNSGAAQFTFTQPIWTGGRTAAAVTAANADVMSGREGLRRLENQLMQAVITAYADVRRDQQALIIRENDVTVLQKQLEESQARFDAGEVTRTDVAQSQTRFAASKSNLASAQAQLASSRATYAALVGHNPGDLEPEPSLAYLMPGNVDEAFDVAERNSPVLRAQMFAEQASRARVAGARADRMPSLVAQGTLRFANGQIDPFLQHQYDTQQTAGLTVTVPMFSGGLTSSRIRQAIERNNADRITVEVQRRSVLQSITTTWNQLLASRANIATTEEQVRAATIAAEGTHEEQRVGLRSTYDVLNAEQELRGAQLSQISAKHDEYVSSAIVLAAMGRLEARNLVPAQRQYDPKANFRRLRLTWGWVPWEEPVGLVDRFLAVPPIPQSHDLPREKAIGPGLQPSPGAPSAEPAPKP
jgi:outer membrane protein